uniref:Uncharacterized protein n=1 Tax=Anguilla anguilla TaxID=7936 RepID=A0A0E9XWJ5_ANGAN
MRSDSRLDDTLARNNALAIDTASLFLIIYSQ